MPHRALGFGDPSEGDFARAGEFATVGAAAKDSSGGKVLSGWEAESGDRLALHLLCFAHCRSVGAKRQFERAVYRRARRLIVLSGAFRELLGIVR